VVGVDERVAVRVAVPPATGTLSWKLLFASSDPETDVGGADGPQPGANEPSGYTPPRTVAVIVPVTVPLENWSGPAKCISVGTPG